MDKRTEQPTSGAGRSLWEELGGGGALKQRMDMEVLPVHHHGRVGEVDRLRRSGGITAVSAVWLPATADLRDPAGPAATIFSWPPITCIVTAVVPRPTTCLRGHPGSF
jgi:hypothetical protein